MRHGCRSSEYSVATGVSLAAVGDVVLTATGPVGGRDGQWTFAQSGAASVGTSLICLSKNTRFRG
jgi:hypothetical protein